MRPTRVFHDFARWVYGERPKPTFKEYVLQHEFVETLQRTVWSGLSNNRLKPANARTADIVLLDQHRAKSCLAVELKNSHELAQAHRDQARRYSEEHEAPCILTNGLEYRVLLSLRDERNFSYAGVAGHRADYQTMDIQLGEIDPVRFHEALEQQLQELFVAAMQGAQDIQGGLARLSKGTGRALPREALGNPRRRAELPESSDALDEFQAIFSSFLGNNEKQKPDSTMRGSIGRTLKDVGAGDGRSAPAFKPNSAISVARALKRELKGMELTISEDSNERATLCVGRLHIVRITEFQLHCRITIRQPEDKVPRGSDVTEKGWRTETFASRDIESLREAAVLIRKLWDR